MALELPETGFLRLPQVLKLFPVCKSTWWAGVRDGVYACGDGTRSIEAHEVELVARTADVVQPDDRLDGLALGEVVTKLRLGAVSTRDQVLGLEPVFEERARRRGCACVVRIPPNLDFLADARDKRGQQLLVSRAAQLLGRWKPACGMWCNGVRGSRKIWVKRHVAPCLLCHRV